MKKILEIKLMSPLCAATGEHHAAEIDLDTALTDCGVPFIPARRLKGLLRESAAIILDAERISEIFGEKGNDRDCGLRISDACVKGLRFDSLPADIVPEQITSLFCSVRAETAIGDDGTAKDNSLRFTRVVDAVSPITKDNLVFASEISFPAEYEEDIENAVKCLRNIGYKKNRGLGSVVCTLSDAEENKVEVDGKFAEYEDDADYEISFTVKNTGDMMLPSRDASHSADFIPGSAVRGMFAGRYDGDDFNSIFFSKDVKFGNAYISEENGAEFFPAPHFFAKVKAPVTDEDKGIHNLIVVTDFTAKQYKPLKDGYINFEKGLKHPAAKIVYHNANTKSGTDEKGLYMQYCIAAGQYFSGCVTAKGNKAEKIVDLLEKDSVMYFGRSKTAQYAACRLVKASVVKAQADPVVLEKGKKAAAVLESDLCLTDENGNYTPALDTLLGVLGITDAEIDASTMITGGEISGYNAKRNLKNTQFPVISAGSAVIFTPKENTDKAPTAYYGEYTNEGFGKVRFYADAAELKVKEGTADGKAELSGEISVLIEAEKTNDTILSEAIAEYSNIKLEATQTGRVTLMAEQAKDLEDFKKRVASIKTDKTRQNAEKLMKSDTFAAIPGEWALQQKYLVTVLNLHKYELRQAKKGAK